MDDLLQNLKQAHNRPPNRLRKLAWAELGEPQRAIAVVAWLRSIHGLRSITSVTVDCSGDPVQDSNAWKRMRRMEMGLEQASAFLNDWVAENVHAVAQPQDNTEAKRLAKRCLEAAAEQGITEAELEEAAGQDLVKCMCDAQAAVADADIGELVEGGDPFEK